MTNLETFETTRKWELMKPGNSSGAQNRADWRARGFQRSGSPGVSWES